MGNKHWYLGWRWYFTWKGHYLNHCYACRRTSCLSIVVELGYFLYMYFLILSNMWNMLWSSIPLLVQGKDVFIVQPSFPVVLIGDVINLISGNQNSSLTLILSALSDLAVLLKTASREFKKGLYFVILSDKFKACFVHACVFRIIVTHEIKLFWNTISHLGSIFLNNYVLNVNILILFFQILFF